MSSPFFINGKASMIIDGQLGSTGKGAILSYLMENEKVLPDISVSVLSPNAGHTVDSIRYGKFVSKQVPISGIMNNRATIYIAPGAVIEPISFLKELERFDITYDRVVIHPRVAVIAEDELTYESNDNKLTSICSTLSGSGAARASKIFRKNKLAESVPELNSFIKHNFYLSDYLDEGCSACIETGQGMDLSINAGLSYPYCTSKDILPSQILADCILHPDYLGNVMATFRTYPIRVGNIIKDGKELGYSGEFPSDSIEITFEELQVPEEYTTVTGRVRRISTFSYTQWEKAHKLIKPTHTFLNFINYLYKEEQCEFFEKLMKTISNGYVGYGPKSNEIRKYSENIIYSVLK